MQKLGFTRQQAKLCRPGSGPIVRARRQDDEGELRPQEGLPIVVLGLAVLRLKNRVNLRARGQASVCLTQESPGTKSSPVTEGSRLARRTGEIAATDRTAQVLQATREPDLRFLKAILHTPRRPLLVERLINPRHEQSVSQAGMKDGCAREEVVGIALVNNQEANLIAHTLPSARELVLGTPQRTRHSILGPSYYYPRDRGTARG